jgi:hypothetical protein
MKDELEEKLKTKYPKIFAACEREPRLPICFGLECGDGWYDLIEEAFEKLSQYGTELFQVKEKFGGLRIYTEDTLISDTEDVHEIIRVAEDKAWKTCEYCGQPGKLRGGNWLKTLCDECEEKRKKERLW